MAAWLEPHPDRTDEQEVDDNLLDEILAARLAMAPAGIEVPGRIIERYESFLDVVRIVSSNQLDSLTPGKGTDTLRASLVGLAAYAMAWVEGIDNDARQEQEGED